MNYSEFAALPTKKQIYLVEFTAREAADQTNTVSLYLSDKPVRFTGVSDPPFKPLIEDIPRVRRSCQAVFKDSSENRWGSLPIKRQRFIAKPISADDEYAIDWLDPYQTIHIDSIISGEWIIRGSELVIRYGGEDLAYSEYREYLPHGIVRGIDLIKSDSITIDIADESARLSDVFVNPNTIAAGTNVPDSSVGKPKPFGLGNCKNVSPILIDQVNYVYLFHDTSVLAANSLDAVYDNGIQLTAGVDYTIDLSNGKFTLTDKPVGVVTCDVKGAVFDSVYQDKPGAIIKGLMKEIFGKTDDDLDLDAIAIFGTAFSYECGLYLTEKTSLRKAFDSLLSGLPAFFDFQDSGFGVWEFGELTESPEIEITDRNLVKGFSMKYDSEIVYKITIGYNKNYTVIPENQSAGSLSVAQKSWFASEYRQTSVSDSAVQTLYPDAVEWDKQTCLISKEDVEAVATKMLNLKKVQRMNLTAEYQPLDLTLRTGMLCRVTDTSKYPLFGLENGKLFRITELQHKNNAVSLTLWG